MPPNCEAYSQIRERSNLQIKDWESVFQEDLVGDTARLVEKMLWARSNLLRVETMGQPVLDME